MSLVKTRGSDAKFTNPDLTASGEPRAQVALTQLQTLWINTGTLCNITCRNCYIESSPKNDRLAYITTDEAVPFFDEAQQMSVREIGFTGGEPFLNPGFLDMVSAALQRGFEVLILTNAMVPMQRRSIKDALLKLNEKFPDQLKLRVSLDHYSKALHEEERGAGTFEPAIVGLNWLAENGFSISIAGRTCWGETEDQARSGYSALVAKNNWPVDAEDPARVILFPEMDEAVDVPEITTACWHILNKSPQDMMCATSRMVVKRKGAEHPVVLPCTLLPYDEAFEMGTTLKRASAANGGMFDAGAVKLCHPHCAKFCVLGGGSCTARD
ncbi:MAG: radical SAM protein [Alphaproteobacteria bacterium]|nr:radical SAM protein [Alphaproteobacteria bacterium]